MKCFSVPADFKKETIDKYHELNQAYEDSKVTESYGNITAGLSLESGRSVDLLPKVDLYLLQEYIEYSKQRNIDFNYTLNPTHMQNREFTGKGVLKIMSFLGKLYNAGVRALTIALPSLIELVKATKYDFKIKASTLCQVTNASKAVMAYKRLGVEKIVVDEAMNRDFDSLRRIRESFGDKVEIIINAICHKNCMYRWFHYNQMSSDSVEITNDTSANFYSHRCVMQRYEDFPDVLKLTWVRPEDIKYYTDIGIHYFKLQGRQAVLKGDPVRTVESYFKESFDGDALELFDMFSPTSTFRVSINNKSLEGFIKPFLKQGENFCKRDCDRCKYCETFANEHLDRQKFEEMKQMIHEFYDGYDQFKQLLDSITKEEVAAETNEPLEAGVEDVDFDIE